VKLYLSNWTEHGSGHEKWCTVVIFTMSLYLARNCVIGVTWTCDSKYVVKKRLTTLRHGVMCVKQSLCVWNWKVVCIHILTDKFAEVHGVLASKAQKYVMLTTNSIKKLAAIGLTCHKMWIVWKNYSNLHRPTCSFDRF
jgi:hypothetical protein